MGKREHIYEIIAENIRKERRRLGITQAELAERADVSLDTIKSVENGRRAICRTLIQEEELKKASKDKRKVTSDEYLISELKAEYDRIPNSTVSCYQSYREGKYTKEEYVQLRKTNQELLADLENQISDLQEKVANQEPDAEEKIEQLTQYSMLEQYDGDVLSNIIDKVLIYNDKDIEVVFKGENFIRNAV